MADLRAVIAEIKARTDLTQIVPDLKKVGTEYMALCWHHHEKTPSLHVSRQFYYCFGCGASGDIINYYQSKGMDFQSALALAAIEAGVALDDDVLEAVNKAAKEREDRQEELYKYQKAFNETQSAQEYIETRGLKPETIKHFELGYRTDWDAIAIPIYGRGGSLDAISFRYMDPNNTQRYYHKNNDLWTKSHSLYNAKALQLEGPVYICEGPFDVITIWQAGFKKTVGLMGSGISDAHIKELAGNTLVFVPDRKTENDFNIFKRSVFRLRNAHPEISIKVALLPDGDANSAGEDAVRDAITNAQVAEYAILKHDLEQCQEQDDEYRVARSIVQDIRDPLVKDDIIKWLCKRWDKDREVVRGALDRSDTAKIKVITVSEGIDQLAENERRSSEDNLSLGWPSLQKFINRPHTKQVAFFAARANVGKTMFALNFLNRAKQDEIPTLILSFEQPVSELINRMMIMAAADVQKVSQAELHHMIVNDTDQWDAMKAILTTYFPHVRFYDKRLTPNGVSDAIIDASYSLGQQVKIVIMDYVGLMKHEMKSNDSYERMSAIARDIQEVTKERDVFGLYLMQLSRKGGDGTEPVTMDMMRDSGVMEEVADYIIGAWKDKENATDAIGMQKMNWAVCKNRHGKTGNGFFWLDQSTLLLHDVDYRTGY